MKQHRDAAWHLQAEDEHLVVQWQDKKASKAVAVITTHGSAEQVTYKIDRDGNELKKPAFIQKYNQSEWLRPHGPESLLLWSACKENKKVVAEDIHLDG